MALGYLAIGTLIGGLAAAAIVATGGGLVIGLGVLSLIGTLATLAATAVGAQCPGRSASRTDRTSA